MKRYGPGLCFLCKCALAILLMALLTTCGSSGNVSSVIVTSKKSNVLCVKHDMETLQSLRRGNKRVVVVVKSFQPPKPPSAGLVAWLLIDDESKRHEIARFAIHPLQAFSVDESMRQQRFLVSLQDEAQFIKDGQALCIEIEFDMTRGKLEGGRADIHIELVQVDGETVK